LFRKGITLPTTHEGVPPEVYKQENKRMCRIIMKRISFEHPHNKATIEKRNDGYYLVKLIDQ